MHSMELVTTALLVIVVSAVASLVAYLLGKRHAPQSPESNEEIFALRADLEQNSNTIGELKKNFENERSLKDELSGKNKQLFVEITNLKAANTSLLREKETLVKEVSDLRANEDRRKKESENSIRELTQARGALEDEKLRIRREDEDRIQLEREERNRMWAEHEERVKIQIMELCKSSQYGFACYDNNNLPISFGGKFKPDVLVEFLSQYVIFDAKVSESDLQNYINSNVKSTVEKINNNSAIYSSVFFVVPTDALKSLKKIRFYEQGYEFFVIPPEAIEVILATFKKIASYELAQQLDPRDRENIVNLIAEFDNHINMRNALDILAATTGANVLRKAQSLQGEIRGEIDVKKSKMRLPNFSPSDIKTLMVSSEIQEQKITALTSPAASIPEHHIKAIKSVLRNRKLKTADKSGPAEEPLVT